MLQHYFDMSYAYFKFDIQMYCIWKTLSNVFAFHWASPTQRNVKVINP